MTTNIIEIRRENLREWFANRSLPEKDKSYISQVLNGRTTFGERAARRLERDYGMGENYLDTVHSGLPLAQTEQDEEHGHRLDYLDVRAAAGLVEYSNADYPEIIQSIWLSDDGMLELVGKRSSEGLRIINVPTDSMEPTIPKGSPVIIDTKVSGYIGDGIYAFSIEGNLFIKRIQKLMKGGYKIISDNKDRYDPEEIDDEFLNNAQFVGKFLRVWKIDTCDL